MSQCMYENAIHSHVPLMVTLTLNVILLIVNELLVLLSDTIPLGEIERPSGAGSAKE